MQGQDSVERQFKYYMPVSTDASKPISLLFEFHGSYEFEAGEEVPNPISGISETHVLNQKAIKENYPQWEAVGIQLLSKCVRGNELTQSGKEIWQSMVNDMSDTVMGNM